MSLITLSTYKAITGTTATTNDVILEAYLLPAVSDAIEKYLQRVLLADNYIQWVRTGQDGLITGLNTPVNRINAIWNQGYVITVTNNEETPISITITQDDLAITVLGTGVTSVYPFDSYATNKYSDLIAAVEADFNITMTLVTGVYDGPCNMLKPETIAIDKAGTGNLTGPYAAICGYKPISGVVKTEVTNCEVLVSYNGGYSTLPYDLQVIVANITRDMLAIQLSGSTPKFKSESQGEYSYSIADDVVPSEVLTPYIKSLDKYYITRY